MKVAIDGSTRFIIKTGTTRYVDRLIREFFLIESNEFSFEEVAWKVQSHSFKQPWRALKTLYREFMWAQMLAPRQLKRKGFDLLHSPIPPIIRAPNGVTHVVTLHDLAVIRQPQRFRKWMRETTRRRLHSATAADHIIAISQFTATEAINLLGFKHRNISVVYHGCNFSSSSTESSPSSCLIPDDFFLFVGNLEPGKNLRLLAHAYMLAQAKGHVLPPLIVVGGRWAGVESEGTWPESWIGFGVATDEELVFLYRRARALLFPSVYEGFGFPPLEAMALGCPVICSRVSSLPEVVGNAALYADLVPGEYLSAMLQLKTSSRLREDLIDAGLERASLFSWGRCADETLQVYKIAMGSR